MEVRPFLPEDLDQINDQAAQAYLRPMINSEQVKALSQQPYAFTGISKGRPVICGGVVEYWANRGEAWAMIDQDCWNEFTLIHRAVKRMLEICPLKRIEATVDWEFQQGHRWVKALGFEVETPRMKAYRPDGGDSTLYVRFN